MDINVNGYSNISVIVTKEIKAYDKVSKGFKVKVSFINQIKLST
jgi:hypothetical protein